MKRILFIIFLFNCVITAAPPRKHDLTLINPDRLPIPAPLDLTVEVPEVIIPALEEALMLNAYGTTGNKLVSVAKQFLGCRYGVGQRGPKRFDCSGLTSWVYELEGIRLGRSSRDQYRDGVEVSTNELKPGDLVFFARGKQPSSIYHVGMVVETDGEGHFRFIHSAHTGVRVDSSSDPYYARHYYGARRILENRE